MRFEFAVAGQQPQLQRLAVFLEKLFNRDGWRVP